MCFWLQPEAHMTSFGVGLAVGVRVLLVTVFRYFVCSFFSQILSRPGVEFGVMSGYAWKVRRMRLAAARDTLVMVLGSMMGSVF